MGERSGYTTDWCDAPHWGLVTNGQMAIEWEDDVEILSSGDIFHCPAGPPATGSKRPIRRPSSTSRRSPRSPAPGSRRGAGAWTSTAAVPRSL